MILRQGEKVHIIHRRTHEKDAHRHFIGTVEGYEHGVARVNGHIYTVDREDYVFIKRPERRTRIISVVTGDVFINVLPETVNLDAIVYSQEKKAIRVSDGSAWHLDISEVIWL